MAMSTGTADGEVMVEMNTTPLIDVMLVLLVLLIVTLPVQTHAVKLDMPAPNATPPTVVPETVELGVDFDGTVSWNGMAGDRPTMDGCFADGACKGPQPEIHGSANRLANSDGVGRVWADA